MWHIVDRSFQKIGGSPKQRQLLRLISNPASDRKLNLRSPIQHRAMAPYQSRPSVNDQSIPQGRPRCLYRGRACYEPRAIKRNGQLHRFCDRHRLEHNGYQRDSQRRRLAREQQRRRLRAQQEPLTLIELSDEILQDAFGSMGDLEPLPLDTLGEGLHNAFLIAQRDRDVGFVFEGVQIMGVDEIEEMLAFLPNLED